MPRFGHVAEERRGNWTYDLSYSAERGRSEVWREACNLRRVASGCAPSEWRKQETLTPLRCCCYGSAIRCTVFWRGADMASATAMNYLPVSSISFAARLIAAVRLFFNSGTSSAPGTQRWGAYIRIFSST